LIKTKVRNRLGSKNLDALLRIALEGPYEEVDDIIGDIDAISLWKKDSKYCFLYANPSTYLNSPNTVSVSDVSLVVCLGQFILTAMVRKFRDSSILTSLWIILGPFCGACIFRRLNP
jgi:hypothetical protein